MARATDRLFQQQQVGVLQDLVNEGKVWKKDEEFALSLCNGFYRFKKLSDKQMEWVEKLIGRAQGEGVAVTGEATTQSERQLDRKTLPLADASALFDSMLTARTKHKKPWPAIRFATDDGKFRLWLDGTGNHIVLSANDKNPETGKRRWFGGISRQGNGFVLVLSNKAPASVEQVMRDFASDPSTAGTIHGKRLGACCYCGTTTETLDSTYYGYGPICASKFGLEWGMAKTRIIEDESEELAVEASGLSGFKFGSK